MAELSFFGKSENSADHKVALLESLSPRKSIKVKRLLEAKNSSNEDGNLRAEGATRIAPERFFGRPGFYSRSAITDKRRKFGRFYSYEDRVGEEVFANKIP